MKSEKKFWKYFQRVKLDEFGVDNFFDKDFMDLVSGLFQYDYKLRIPLKEVKEHDYLKGLTITRDEVIQEMTRRVNKIEKKKEAMMMKESQQMQIMFQQTISTAHTTKIDRAVPPEVLQILGLRQHFAKLEDIHPTVRVANRLII